MTSQSLISLFRRENKAPGTQNNEANTYLHNTEPLYLKHSCSKLWNNSIIKQNLKTFYTTTKLKIRATDQHSRFVPIDNTYLIPKNYNHKADSCHRSVLWFCNPQIHRHFTIVVCATDYELLRSQITLHPQINEVNHYSEFTSIVCIIYLCLWDYS